MSYTSKCKIRNVRVQQHDQSEKAICDSSALYISYFDKYLDNKVVRCKSAFLKMMASHANVQPFI